MRKIVCEGRVPTSAKYKIDDRYFVYVYKTSAQNFVIDTVNGKDITGTKLGQELIIAAYNYKNKFNYKNKPEPENPEPETLLSTELKETYSEDFNKIQQMISEFNLKYNKHLALTDYKEPWKVLVKVDVEDGSYEF